MPSYKTRDQLRHEHVFNLIKMNKKYEKIYLSNVIKLNRCALKIQHWYFRKRHTILLYEQVNKRLKPEAVEIAVFSTLDHEDSLTLPGQIGESFNVSRDDDNHHTVAAYDMAQKVFDAQNLKRKINQSGSRKGSPIPVFR